MRGKYNSREGAETRRLGALFRLVLHTIVIATALFGCSRKISESDASGIINSVRAGDVAKGANVSATDIGGTEPLSAAAVAGHSEVVELLLVKGADVNAVSKSGETALHMAAIRGQKTVVALLLAKGANVNAKTVEYLGSGSGITPLHWAAMRGHTEIVTRLVAKRADVSARTSDSKTPLSIAIKHDRKEIIELLSQHGAKE